MAKPLVDCTDNELEAALAEGNLDERKTAIAREILSRRWKDKSQSMTAKYGLVAGTIAAALVFAFVALRRLLNRR